MAESYPIVWMDHTYGHLGCCHFLALVKSAAGNIPVEFSRGLAGVFVKYPLGTVHGVRFGGWR